MQAIRLEKSNSSDTPSIKIDTVPIPKADGDHVVIKVIATAIQPSDRLNARGGFDHTSFPRTPGRDFAGVIVDGPPEQRDRQVFGTGGALLGFSRDGPHAEYCLVHKDLLADKPPGASFVEAAAIGVPFTTAYLCLRRARATKSDTVLVIGSSGSVGSAAVQIARAIGCEKVYGAARRDNADVNLATDPQFDKLSVLTGGKGVDVIIDTVGSLDVMGAASQHLAQRGRYAFISAPRGANAVRTYEIDLLDTYRRELEFVGCNSASASPAEVGADLKQLSGLLADGLIHAPEEKSLGQTTLSEVVGSYQTGKGLQIMVFPP